MPIMVAQMAGPGRWPQINFPMGMVQQYFNVDPEVPSEIRLRHVSSTGALGPIETRNPRAKPSINWGFQLAAANDLGIYPGKDHPPIALLARDNDIYYYHILMPGDAAYPSISDALTDAFVGPSHYKKRVLMPDEDVANAWPTCPLIGI